MIIVLVTVTMIVIIRVRNIMRIPAIVIVIIIIIDIIFFLLSVLSEPHRVIYVTTDFIFIDFTRSRDLCKSSFHFRDRDSSPEIFKDFVRRTHCRDDIDISLLQFIPNIDGSNTQGEGGKRGGG